MHSSMQKPCSARDRLVLALALAADRSQRHPGSGFEDPAEKTQSAPEIRELLLEHCKVHGC